MFLHEFPNRDVRKRTNIVFEQISAFPARVHGQCKLALKMSKVMQKLMQIVKMYIVGTWGAHTYVEELCKGQQTLQLTLAINQIIIIRPTVKHNWLKKILMEYLY